MLHRIGFVEKAGTGIKRIREEANSQGCPEPEFEVGSFFTATFQPSPMVHERTDGHITKPFADYVTVHVTDHVTDQVRLLSTMSGEMTPFQLQQALRLTHKGHFRTMHLLPAIQAGLIEMTIPDKPRSNNQRYRLTPKGRDFLRQVQNSHEWCN